MKSNKLSLFFFTFIVLLAVWIAVTASTETQEIVFGIAVAVGVAIGTYKLFTERGLVHLAPKKILYFLVYIPYYFYQVIVANLDVVYRVLSPSLPIKPGFVIAKTNLKTDSGKLGLANSITLTPGTITADISGDEVLVHWIYVKDATVEGATSSIVHPFEKFLEVIFG
ncbi:MAG: Na+/H+ antiporter subunit E [Caldisericaceae bacterium]